MTTYKKEAQIRHIVQRDRENRRHNLNEALLAMVRADRLEAEYREKLRRDNVYGFALSLVAPFIGMALAAITLAIWGN